MQRPVNPYAAIILAAGFSKRMGRFKPLLPLGDATVMQRVINSYRKAGVSDIRVVVGHRAEEIRQALAGQNLRTLHNPDFAQGMFSSVRTGVAALDSNCSSFFVHPVDIPLVRPHTIRKVMATNDQTPAMVVFPVFDGHRGHPPLIDVRLKSKILDHDGTGGLRALLKQYDHQAREVDVADEGILRDLDTPVDYETLKALVTGTPLLTDAESSVLLREIRQLPDNIIAHCDQVSQVAVALATAINTHGGNLEIALVKSAASVHDLARLEPDHAAAGAAMLEQMGFGEMATIVARHMALPDPEAPELDEACIVHLADKLVAGDKVVGLEARFEASLQKHGRDQQVRAIIRQRHQEASALASRVEQATGQTIGKILTQAGIEESAHG